MNSDRTEPTDRAHATDARNPGSRPRASVSPLNFSEARGCCLSAQKNNLPAKVEAGWSGIRIRTTPETASPKKKFGRLLCKAEESHSPLCPLIGPIALGNAG